MDIGRLYSSLGGYCRFDGMGDRLATPLPVTHMNALACSLMAMLTVGGCLIQLDRFHPATWWQSHPPQPCDCVSLSRGDAGHAAEYAALAGG